MKNTMKCLEAMRSIATQSRWLCAIALIAVIGFSFAACELSRDDTPTLTGITANYTGGSVALNTDVNSLKSNLTVTAEYSDNTSKTLNDEDYSLSGDLSLVEQNIVTVTYKDKTTFFTLTINPVTGPVYITYIAEQTGGIDNIADTTGIAFFFSEAVSDLTADDITVTNVTGEVTTGDLSGSDTSWSLAVTVTVAGYVNVSINKTGIEAEAKFVTVYKAEEEAPILTGITAVYAQGAAIIYPDTPLDDLKAGLTVKAEYLDGNEIILSANEYTLSGILTAGTFTVGTSTVTVTYQDRTTYFTVSVTALKTLTYITLNTASVKKTYTQNEQLNLVGLVVTANYNDSTSKIVSYTSSSPANGTTLSTAGTITIMVNYTEEMITRSYAFTVTVTAAYTAEQTGGADGTMTSTGIVFTFYESVDSLNLSAADITVGGTASKGTAALTGTGATRTLAITVNEAGMATVSINKTGIEAETKHVTVYKAGTNAPTLTGITAAYTQGGTVIYPNTPLDILKEGLTVKAQYSNGSENTLSASEYTLSGTLTTGTVTVTYQGKTAAFTVTVTPKTLEGITLNTASVKRDYNLNEQLNLSGLVVTANYNDGTSAAVTAYATDPENGLTLISAGTITITVNYTEETITRSGTFTITVTITPGGSGASKEDAILLTENIWADGNLPTSSSRQWFVFIATADTQYIHAAFFTLNNAYGVNVRVYDSRDSNIMIGFAIELRANRPNIDKPLEPGQTYYIWVSPAHSSYTGTYRIAFNKSSSTAPREQLPSNAIPLTADQWANGSLPTSSGYQWFTFTADAAAQYIHAYFDTLTQMYVQVFDSGGVGVGSETKMDYDTIYTPRSLTVGQTYYIRVRPNDSSDSGTYRIGFNTSFIPPGVIPLTVNEWTDGSLPRSSDVQWFSFTTDVAVYWIHADFGTLSDLYVNVYNSSGSMVTETPQMDAITRRASRLPLTAGQTYYIRVRPGDSGGGDYRIALNVSIVPPGINPIPLTVNQWTNGSLPTSSDQQWFTFTATASSPQNQYIHFELGTLTDLYMQVYNSDNTTAGSEIRIDSSSYVQRSLTAGQTYYIRIRPNGSRSGTYRIAFTTSSTPPPP